MYERRLLRLFFGIATLLLVVLGRAFYVQVVAAEGIVRAQDQVFRSTKLVRAHRGEILWADGTPAVRNGSSWSLRIDVPAFDGFRYRCARCGETTRLPRPSDEKATPESAAGRLGGCTECRAVGAWVPLPEPDTEALARLLGVEAPVLRAEIGAAQKAARDFRWRTADLFNGMRKLRISTETAAALALRAREFPGIEVHAVPSREADPEIASLAGTTRLPWETDVDALRSDMRVAQGLHVYTREETLGTLIGNTGMEARLDERFRGVPGIIERPAPRRGESPPEPVVVRPVEDGTPLRTTLRRDLQRIANEIVAGAADDPPAGAVVLDLTDGAVVAAAGRAPDPYFRPVTPLTPGSVFKLVTALAALEAGVDPSATFTCEAKGRLANGQKYTCTHVHATVDLTQAFEGSCNGFFMTRAMDAGPRWMADAYARLGMDVMPRLGMGFSPRDGRILDFGSQTALLGIGQAHALATPIQVATAYARLATRGRRIVPYLDREVGPDPGSRTVDPEIARHAGLLLDAAHLVVVGSHGTAHGVAGLVALDAAGKTGTAELDSSKENRKRNAWFVGFAPHDAPRFVAVVVREGLTQGGGAALAAPDVARLLEAALRER